MMPKVTMQAPAGVGGQIHASKTQQVYTVGEDGTVVVDSADVSDLLGAGYTTVPAAGGPGIPAAAPITSESLTSDTEGAQALDPKARELGATETAKPDQPLNSADFGSATPPHGVATTEPGSAAEALHDDAEADLVQQAKDLSGHADAGTSTNVASTEQRNEDKAVDKTETPKT